MLCFGVAKHLIAVCYLLITNFNIYYLLCMTEYTLPSTSVYTAYHSPQIVYVILPNIDHIPSTHHYPPHYKKAQSIFAQVVAKWHKM